MIELYNQTKDNCGCGIIGNIHNKPSRKLTLDAIEALCRMIHRGAIASDQKSGDGAGFLFSMPYKFIEKIAKQNNVELSSEYAVATIFSKDEKQLDVFSDYCQKNDLKVLFSRLVPVNDKALGKQAKESQPKIFQVFVTPNALVARRRFQALCFLTRREVETYFSEDNDFYIASFSSDSLSYKGLVMPTYMSEYFLDLNDNDFESSFALFHQRFSTNTLPNWRLAQPFRSLCHNGEINSIQANIFNVLKHQESIKSEVFTKKELEKLFPIIPKKGSDSMMLDNFLEFLLINGVDFFQATRSLIQPPWQNAPYMDSSLRCFYEFISRNFETWDGPAAVNITDGRYLACVLDRNGLRPAKYIITSDNQFIIGSEFGIVDVKPDIIIEQGRLRAGEMMAIDLKHGEVLSDKDISSYIKGTKPYSKWLNTHAKNLQQYVDRNFGNFDEYVIDDDALVYRYHNITHEILEVIVTPMTTKGIENTGSMGDDVPLACLSEKQRNFSEYFRQKFAQVTNPPIDPLRERVVMSTSIVFGRLNNILENTVEHAHQLHSVSPVLNFEKLDVLMQFGDPTCSLYQKKYRHKVFYTSFQKDLKKSLENLGEAIIHAVIEEDLSIIILEDRVLSAENKLMPMAMVVGYLNNLLINKKLRSRVSLVAITGEVHDSHSLAVLLGFGTTAVYPYLLFSAAFRIIKRQEHISNSQIKLGLQRVVDALNKGLLKIMSKMGISTIDSYCNSSLFDIIGLSKEIQQCCFPRSYPLLPGLCFNDIENRLEMAHNRAFESLRVASLYPLEIGSFYKYMKSGEYHDFGPDVVYKLHHFTDKKTNIAYESLSKRINQRGNKMIRDLFVFDSDKKSISIDQVEPIEDITCRFSSAAMSLGSISEEAHETIAEAMNYLGGRSNSGEGGEDTSRFNTKKNSKIKQVASGRFGVTPNYLRNAEEIQIKVAQGAKPGEGGQLPGSKVSPQIASLRCTMPGVTLISPPPHHDIYSIEDLAQLIYDLKQINPKAQIGVKLVSSAGVGTIACGVAKAYADKIIISGADGGTGAAQLGSIKFAGNPFELGLVEAHNALKRSKLRHLVELQTDGGLKTGLDVVKAAIMGAESFAFGTVLLSAVGCKILRICHLNKCSVGIATQDEFLRKHFKGAVENVIAYLQHVAGEVREILASIGYKSLNDVIGRTYLLKDAKNNNHPFDTSALLYYEEIDSNTRTINSNDPYDDNKFEKEILEELKDGIKGPYPQYIDRKIKNANRSFGALISGYIAELYGDNGLPKHSIVINLKGTAGQSLGAFNNRGVTIRLKGTANDYVGKGMRGGQIMITPNNKSKNPHIAGNTCMYGATGGRLYVRGSVGERFAVRNSGAIAVVEGTGNHACEYMTGGAVIILGETGINFGAGMTGGVAFVYDPEKKIHDKANQELIQINRIDIDQMDEARYYLKRVLNHYYRRTNSAVAKHILLYFREEIRYFWLITPKEMQSPLNPFDGN